jgi:hypothetical protein
MNYFNSNVKRKGFTLIEIITMVSAIAVLSVASLATFKGISSAIARAKRADVANEIKAVAAKAVALKGVIRLEENEWAALTSLGGLPIPVGLSSVTLKLQNIPVEGAYVYTMVGDIVPAKSRNVQFLYQ